MTTPPRISALELHKLILAGLVKPRIDAVPVIKKKSEYQRRWRLANPEKYRESNRKAQRKHYQRMKEFAGQGRAGQGPARQGSAGQGEARLGEARQG